VLLKAILTGAAGQDFFGIAYGLHDGKYEGFQLGSDNVQLDDTLLLIEPEAAKQYAASAAKSSGSATAAVAEAEGTTTTASTVGGTTTIMGGGTTAGTSGTGSSRPKLFHGTVEVPPATAKMRLVQIAEEIVSVLLSDPNATVKVVLEISAEFPDGAKDGIKRAVSENARTLELKSADWE
jgi:hypothetical protein